jgi:hypothetical protein
LLTEEAEEVRRESRHIMKHSKPPNNNTTKAEHDMLRTMLNNRGMLVLLADKTNASVVITANKLEELLNEQNCKLTTDPTKAVERKTIKLIRQFGIAENADTK